MRNANIYRAAKRNEARALGLDWRRLVLIRDTNGTRVVKYPFEMTGKGVPVAAGKAPLP